MCGRPPLPPQRHRLTIHKAAWIKLHIKQPRLESRHTGAALVRVIAADIRALLLTALLFYVLLCPSPGMPFFRRGLGRRCRGHRGRGHRRGHGHGGHRRWHRHRRPNRWGGCVVNYGSGKDTSDSSDDGDEESICGGGQGTGGQGQVDGGQGTGETGGQGSGGIQGDFLVEKVDFQVEDNTQKHQTDQYDITEGPNPQLVVRRGQPFHIQIVFSRAYDTNKDDLRLVFQIGNDPKPSKGTRVEFVLSDKDEEGEWGAQIAQQTNKTLTLQVFTPPDCIVGKWRLKVNVVKKADNETTVFSYRHKNPIYVLFNPWCKADTVFMENPKHLEAYVLNENGKLYAGSHHKWTAKPWVYGQFTGKVLDCSMYLLDVSELAWGVRGDPVRVIRKLSAMVNCQDEGGVLVGNWSNDYRGGKSPLSWTGSAPILEQFYNQKVPVKYGQCWVFSGVLTTVCRALGIPTRSVTNFLSAHDADNNVTIDLHYKGAEPLREYDDDSIWNFHVWNEAWMARPDLPAGYGGWQAFDATPQETSDGVYCCGPYPVKAIKEGEITLPYDGPFIFAEVNADKIFWLLQKDGSWKKGNVLSSEVGRLISTLSVEGGRREDITLNYKYPEGSQQERAAVSRATRKDRAAPFAAPANAPAAPAGPAGQAGRRGPGPLSRRGARMEVDVPMVGDVDFDVKFDTENTFVGNDFQMDFHMKNNGGEARTVEGKCVVSTMFYTGVDAEKLVTQPIQNLTLKPGESVLVSVKVPEETYHGKLRDCCMLSLSVCAEVKETEQTFIKKDSVRLRKPHLSIKGPASVKKGQQIEVEVSFANPLKRTLTDCYLEVEGAGIRSGKTYPQGEVSGKSTFTTTLKVMPVKKGHRELVVIFNSKEVEDINGSHAMDVHR